MKRVLLRWSLVVLAHVTPARAQEPSAVKLWVDAWPVPGELVRDALALELGQAVVLVEDPVAPPPLLSIAQTAPDSVQLRYVDAVGHALERVLEAPRGVQDAVASLTFVAANLVRNEADDILRDLAPPPPIAPPVGHTFRVARLEPPRAARPAPHGPTPCSTRATRRLGADFLPFVGSSSTRGGRSAVRGLSLGLFGALSEGLHGLQISGGPAVQRRGACGVSIAAVGQLVLGPARGLEIGAVNLVYGPMVGANLGLLNATRGYTGLNFGLANLAFGTVQGVSLGLANVSGRRTGLALGLMNLSYGAVYGLDLGLLNVDVRELRGVSLGFLNVAGTSLRGAQLGFVNATLGDAHGLQLGLVNIARRSSSSIGLVNILYGGRTDVVLWSTETGHILAGVEHGDGRLYNVYGIGLRVGSPGSAPAIALGLGVRALERERFELDVDTVVTYLPTLAGEGGSWLQATLRVPLRYQFGERFGVFAAPTWSLWLADDASADAQVPWPETLLREGPRPRTTAWPGASVGASVALNRARSK